MARKSERRAKSEESKHELKPKARAKAKARAEKRKNERSKGHSVVICLTFQCMIVQSGTATFLTQCWEGQGERIVRV